MCQRAKPRIHLACTEAGRVALARADDGDLVLMTEVLLQP
jgi:hypothetical protein